MVSLLEDRRRILLNTPHVEEVSDGIASFKTDVPAKLKKCVVDIDPVQDLHGYDYPWPAGGGKNLFNIADIQPFNENVIITKTNDTFSVTNNNNYIINPFRGDGKDIEWNLPPGQYTISIGNVVSSNLAVYASSDGSSYSWFDNGISAGYLSKTFTVSAEKPFIIIRGTIRANESMTISKFQLESGSTATSYAPYSNICPISGRTGMKVEKRGKNLLPNKLNQQTSTTVVLGQTEVFQTHTISLKAGTYTLTVNGTVDGSIYVSSDNGLSSKIGSMPTASFTLSEDDKISLRLYLANGIDASTILNFQLEEGSEATSYEPYTGETYDITFLTEAGTVYGGTLDMLSGVLTVNMAMVDMGTLPWAKYLDVTNPVYYAIMYGMDSTRAMAICSQYRFNENWIALNVISDKTAQTHPSLSYIYVRDDDYPDATAFKTAMSGVQLCYELANPITYQLDPHTLKALRGTNNIWSGTGDTTVRFWTH